MPADDEVLAVHGEVSEERGRYVVHLVVVLAGGAVRRRVGDYADRGLAEIAAREVARNAGRHLPPPPDPR